MNDMAKNLLLWVVIAVVLLTVFQSFNPHAAAPSDVAYSNFTQQVSNGGIASVVLSAEDPTKVTAKLKDGTTVTTMAPVGANTQLVDLLAKANVEVRQLPLDTLNPFVRLLLDWVPILIFIGLLIYFMRQMQAGAGGRGAMSFGRSRAKLQGEDQVKITFADVAGCDEAKEEVSELVEFLRDPSKFTKLGGKIPRGVLMIGAPGTGKTLLAKAIAGEAKVPFFSISGSDFVEMFVGVGAARVRDMFEQAKKQAPCIIFIDEIDAVGRHRGAGLGGGHDEREQTLNQLLVEMDGFEGSEHMRKVPISNDVEPMTIARGTPGFSGADLANLVNEAALFAARGNSREVVMQDFERAKDKIMMGAERRSMIMSDDEKKLTAYHEAGHAIVGLSVPEHDPVHKVTIIPRGRALGVTMFLPESDRYSHSKTSLESRLASLYGGRVAEELIFGEDKVTTGASNDIQRATALARDMVTKYGLSEELGPMTYAEEDDEVFLGRSVTQHKHVSEETARKIDEVVRSVIDRAYSRAREILTTKTNTLEAMAGALLQYETIDREQIAEIMAGRVPNPPKNWTSDSKPGSGSGPSGGAPRGESPIGGPAVQPRVRSE